MDNIINIGELRANKSGNAADWTPVECLEDMIKGIKEGRINPDGLIVCFYNETEHNGIDIKFSQAMPNVLMASGTLQRVNQLLGS